ncbi:hypothetical protein C7999DRAFT_32520 [Corynascus novoguineensis]|uniref:Short-chain dehydrogenase n=1 Tax=Corynascus novoguineensis TaxID=1126955 RepID=A0AAN7CTM2_9PEZI|nr:hypothetical protein C7999DRAFT_32520 [Corynascus novoguineensis]
MATQYGLETTGSQLVRELASHIRGKVVLTTGVSPRSLGAEFVLAIAAAEPALLILAGRDLVKVQQTAQALTEAHPSIPTRLLRLDLGSLAAVREAAAELMADDTVPAVDVLVNSAGIMALGRYETTPEGLERQFGTNHLGHFLFTNLIMNKLLAGGPGARVVCVSSSGHRLSPIRWDDLDFHGGNNYNKWHAYGQSKTANMLMAVSLAEKLGNKGLRAFSLHPGVIYTNLGDHVDWEGGDYAALQMADRALGNKEGWDETFQFKTTDQGIATHVFAAFHPSLADHNGVYLIDSQIADPWIETVKPWATSPVEAERLWKLSEKLVGQEFNY